MNAHDGPGVCRVCGCTEDRACVESDGFPCRWVRGTNRTLCTACEALADGPNEPPDLGPCCACGREGPGVRNLLMLPVKAPIPGTGWACLQCGLPPDGALAVLCDSCVDRDVAPCWAVEGLVSTRGRFPIGALTDPFDHRMDLHPEAEEAPGA